MTDSPAHIREATTPEAAMSLEQRQALAVRLHAEALTHLQKKEWKDFFPKTFRAAKTDPGNKQACTLAIQALIALSRPADAQIVSTELQARHPLDKELLKNHILTVLQNGDYPHLIASARRAIREGHLDKPTLEAWTLAQASAHYFRGEFKCVAPLLNTSILQRNRDAFLLRVNIAAESGKIDEAVSLLEQATQSNPADADMRLQLVKCLETGGRVTDARAVIARELIRDYGNATLRLRQIDLLNAPEEANRRARLIAAYREDFRNRENAMMPLCEFAAVNGDTELCRQLRDEADTFEHPGQCRFHLLYVESFLSRKLTAEAETALDKIPDAIRDKMNAGERDAFRRLRTVIRLVSPDRGAAEMEISRVEQDTGAFDMGIAENCARRLIALGDGGDAIYLIEVAYQRNGRRPADLGVVFGIHAQAGGDGSSLIRFRETLDRIRPTRKYLKLAQKVLNSGKYPPSEAIDKLNRDIAKLLAGDPVVLPIPESPTQAAIP